MRLPDSVYNCLKWFALIAIPAITAFLSVVLPALKVDAETVNTITTIISATGALIGALIGVSTYGYNKAKEVSEDGKKV